MIEGKVNYLGKPSTRSTQTPSSWILVCGSGGERVSEEVRVTMMELRKESAA
jgi:hypothetical protein